MTWTKRMAKRRKVSLTRIRLKWIDIVVERILKEHGS